MNFVRVFLEKPIISHFLFFGIFIFGLIAVLRMPVEEMPAVNLDFAFIVTIYPGASPDEIERIITIPIEDACANVQDIDKITSRSQNGKSVVMIEFVENVKNYEQRVMDLQNEMTQIPNLPDRNEMAGPYVYKISFGDTIPIINVMLSGDLDGDRFKEIADDLKRELTSKIKDIKNIEVAGVADKEVAVFIDTARLALYGMTIDDVFLALMANNFRIPGGEVDVSGKRYLLRTIGNFKEVEQIESVVVKQGIGSSQLLLKDIAKIEKKFVRGSITSNLNGKKAVSLYVMRRAGSNVVATGEEVKTVSAAYLKQYPEIDLSFQNDSGKEVNGSIQTLRNNALLGMVLVFVVLFLFLGWRPAFLATIAIPFSFLAAFLTMRFFGFTINSLSLFALILASGMIVDQAIVVIENVFRHRQLGLNRFDASLKGTAEVIWPVFSSVLTTVVAFLPLLLISGIIGKFIRELPWVVSITLLASLMEAMVILPIHLYSMKKLSRQEGEGQPHWWDRILGAYAKWLNFQISHRYLTALAILLLFGASLFVAKQLKIILFGEEITETLIAKVELAENTPIEKTRETLKKMEQYILSELYPNEAKDVVVVVGRYIEDHRWVTKENVAELRIDMTSDDAKFAEAMRKKLRVKAAAIPEIISFEFIASGDGPPTGRPIDISIAGREIGTLTQIGEEMLSAAKKIPGVVDINSVIVEKSNEFQVVPDMDGLARAGVTLAQLSAAVRGYTAGRYAGKYQDTDGREISIWIRLTEGKSYSLDELRAITIRNQTGSLIRLGDVAKIKEVQTLANIRRENRSREIRVQANVDYTKTTPREANQELERQFKDIPQRFPGYAIDFQGEAADQKRVIEEAVYAFLAAFVMIFIILGIQFNSSIKPLIVMTTLPFGFIGVAFGLYFSGLPLSFTALISLVALSGIVVNNAIILVDFINNYSKDRPRREALIEAGKTRLRPILLTTTTTIGGLIPTVLFATGSNKLWQPMAITLIWGLLFATILTLFIIPCFYEILADIKGLFIRNGTNRSNA